MSDKFVMRDQFDRWQRVWHQGQYDLIHSCHPGDGHGLHVGGRPAGFTNSRYASAYKLCEGRPRTARRGESAYPTQALTADTQRARGGHLPTRITT